MNQQHPQTAQLFEEITRRLRSGLILVSANGEVVWMDESTRRSIDGGLEDLQLPLRRDEQAIDCFISTLDVLVNGESKEVCVVQAVTPDEAARNLFHDLIDSAIQEVMSDSSWLTRPLTEKLKAWCQIAQPNGRTMDLDALTGREREILALLCEGRSDAEMSALLKLSQNTVRNHVASLFRKIGVNRRSAAIIWARERGITRHDVLAVTAPRRLPHSN